MELLMHEVQL